MCLSKVWENSRTVFPKNTSKRLLLLRLVWNQLRQRKSENFDIAKFLWAIFSLTCSYLLKASLKVIDSSLMKTSIDITKKTKRFLKGVPLWRFEICQYLPPLWKRYVKDFTLKHLLLFEIWPLELCEKFVYEHSETIENAKN